MVFSFYGFPSHYYKEKYPNKGSKEIALQVTETLESHGVNVKSVSRGLDHGVWVSFKIGKNIMLFRFDIPSATFGPFEKLNMCIINEHTDLHIEAIKHSTHQPTLSQFR